jgi:outer membrane protein assembly factor BamB
MQKGNLKKYITYTFAIAFAVAFVFWFVHDPVADFTRSVPGLDNRPKQAADADKNVKIGEKFKVYKEATSDLKGQWARFRGADFDNINKENIPLIDSFEGKPDILWQVDMGEGHAAAAIHNGKVYVLDYDEIKKADVLRCFLLETGEELWKRWYNVKIKRNHGISRTIPAVTDKYVVTIGPKCHVMCSDPNTGDLLWGIDLMKEFELEIPFWNTGQCPIIDNDVAILAPGGRSLLIAVDCKTGEILWETPNEDGWKMSHSSIIPMTYGGKKMYVYAAVGGMVGVSAEGADLGKVVWKTKAYAPAVVAPSPLILPEGKIFMTAGYGAGSVMLQLKKNGQKFTVDVLQKFRPKEGLASEQQTPIYYNGLIYGILPKDAGGMKNQMVCYSPLDCTKPLFSSGKAERYGLGPYVVADDKFFILDDDGTLSIVKMDGKKFTLLDKVSIIDGHDAWGPIAIADGKLIMRDSKTMLCINIRK